MYPKWRRWYPSASKKGKGDSNSSSILSNKQIVKIAAAVAKVGKKNGKKDAKFDKEMARLLSILVGSNSPVQIRGIIASSPAIVDEAKMAQVAVVIKSIMQKCQKSKDDKDNGE